jgi:hypothetical protein
LPPSHLRILLFHTTTIVQAFRDPGYLEDLTGLTELHKAGEAAFDSWASSDEDAKDDETGEQ